MKNFTFNAVVRNILKPKKCGEKSILEAFSGTVN